jgi:putative hydrolase of the HAD superfamily
VTTIGPSAAILIDLYDTLVWGEWPSLRDVMAARIGVSGPELQAAYDLTRPSRGVGAYEGAAEDMAAVLATLGLEPERTLVEDLLELERASLEVRVHLFDDSIPTLRALRARGIRTGLVSNCSRSTRPVVDRLGLEHEVDAVVLSFEVGAAKPEPAIYRHALDRLQASPSDTAYVDDQPIYCDGAAAVGMRTYLIRRGDPPADGDGADPDADGHIVITELSALLA